MAASGSGLVGFIIDVVIVSVIGAVLGGVIGAILGNPGAPTGLLVGLAYVVGMNANGGTLGKRAVGLRLESDKTGEDIGYGAALIRYIVAFASAIVLFIGYLWVIWDPKNQTWHDKAAGSVVVTSASRRVRPGTEPFEGETHPGEDVDAAIRRLGKLREDGLITSEEYAQKRREVIDRSRVGRL